MTETRQPLPPMPPSIARLPRDSRGFPIPWFVAMADFRIADPSKLARAHRHKRCWICGEPLGRFMAFTIGPMCAINRISGEPPSHRKCAEFSVRACPFLSRPRMRRNEKDLPSDAYAEGVMIKRNPGVILIWMTESYTVENRLFVLGEPTDLQFFAEGRQATDAEIAASIESGLPLLYDLAKQDGPTAIAALRKQVEKARPLLPPFTAGMAA